MATALWQRSSSTCRTHSSVPPADSSAQSTECSLRYTESNCLAVKTSSPSDGPPSSSPSSSSSLAFSSSLPLVESASRKRRSSASSNHSDVCTRAKSLR